MIRQNSKTTRPIVRPITLNTTADYFGRLRFFARKYREDSGNDLDFTVRISDGISEERQDIEIYQKNWDVFSVTLNGIEYGPLTYVEAAKLMADIHTGYCVGVAER